MHPKLLSGALEHLGLNLKATTNPLLFGLLYPQLRMCVCCGQGPGVIKNRLKNLSAHKRSRSGAAGKSPQGILQRRLA